MNYTYNGGYGASYCGVRVSVPDRVAEDTVSWEENGSSFPAIRDDGSMVRVKLMRHVPGGPAMELRSAGYCR